MPKLPTSFFVGDVQRQLHQYDGLGHLRVRARGDLLTIESGPEQDPTPHARLRQDTVHLWRLEMATHSGRWEPTPFRDTATNLVATLVEQFGWTLAPQD